MNQPICKHDRLLRDLCKGYRYKNVRPKDKNEVFVAIPEKLWEEIQAYVKEKKL